MRAIIIEDKDAKELVRRLELAKLSEKYHSLKDWDGLGEIKAKVHRVFHLEVVQWLQDQGADVVR